MQKINKPGVECDDPEEVSAPKSCSEHVSRWDPGPGPPGAGAAPPRPGAGKGGGSSRPTAHTPCPQRAECERLLTAPAFEGCLALVPLEPYVQACAQDRCQCPPGASCECSTLAEFSRQCSHAGGQPGSWRTAALCRKRRREGPGSGFGSGAPPAGEEAARGGPGPAALGPAPLPAGAAAQGPALPFQPRPAPETWSTWRAARPAWTPAPTWRSVTCARSTAWTAASAPKVRAPCVLGAGGAWVPRSHGLAAPGSGSQLHMGSGGMGAEGTQR